MTSFPSRAKGMVCSWMGLASTKPAFSISANNSADKLNSLNFNSFFFLKSGAKPLYHTSFQCENALIAQEVSFPVTCRKTHLKENPIVFLWNSLLRKMFSHQRIWLIKVVFQTKRHQDPPCGRLTNIPFLIVPSHQHFSHTSLQLIQYNTMDDQMIVKGE